MGALTHPFAASGIRPFEIRGDAMQPSLRSGDFLMVRPATRYEHEGVYLLGGEGGEGPIHAERRIGSDVILVWHENPIYGRWEMPLNDFNANVTAKVVAEVKMKEPLARLAELSGGRF